jgi:hypothetical protein
MSGQSCACCPAVDPPRDFPQEPARGLTEEEMVWCDDKHLDLTSPEVLSYLDKDLGTDSSIVDTLATSYGCCSSFKVLNDEGIRAMNLSIDSIEKYAVCSPRIPKVLRGGTFRSKFLNGMGHSQAVLRHVSQLAGCEMIYHPMKIQQLHINFKPDDDAEVKGGKKNVDRWHCDTTAFVLIVFATDPDEYTGGELQYFAGTREEGTQLLKSGAGLPADRVLNVGRQKLGYGVFMQGSRVFHQVTPVLSGIDRTTVVYSFQPRNVLALEAATLLARTYNNVDPLHIFMSDWARYRAWKCARRLELFQEHFGGQAYALPADLVSAVKRTEKLLTDVNRTLPYTDDRELMKATLTAAVVSLREQLQAHSGNAGSMADSVYGLPNLKGVITDIDSCVEDIMTLKDSSMEYF